MRLLGRQVDAVPRLKLQAQINWLRNAATERERQMGRLEAQYNDALSRLHEFDSQDALVKWAQGGPTPKAMR